MPIPQEIVNLLQTEKLCFLATSHLDQPHASLMNFTYLAEEGCIIISSRPDTAKMKNIVNNPEVALLLYSLGENKTPVLGCTLHGKATVLPADQARNFREAHYRHHPDMGPFIEGDNIAVVLIRINRAAISDLKDHVRTWDNSNA
jgi:nitroimidazol reductase NimA-like FMN-containing flavoprotein (pyridoxamine 5'-phosphate oxidase superfamily)